MSTFVLDAGALIAVERGERDVLSMLQTAFTIGHSVRVPVGVIGQVWRDPGRQAVLSRTLKRCEEVALDGSTARAAGRLCGWTDTTDVIDASIAIAVADSRNRGDRIVLITSDSRDMRVLLSALDSSADLIEV